MSFFVLFVIQTFYLATPFRLSEAVELSGGFAGNPPVCMMEFRCTPFGVYRLSEMYRFFSCQCQVTSSVVLVPMARNKRAVDTSLP